MKNVLARADENVIMNIFFSHPLLRRNSTHIQVNRLRNKLSPISSNCPQTTVKLSMVNVNRVCEGQTIGYRTNNFKNKEFIMKDNLMEDYTGSVKF